MNDLQLDYLREIADNQTAVNVENVRGLLVALIATIPDGQASEDLVGEIREVENWISDFSSQNKNRA